MCCKVPRCWLRGFELVVGFLGGGVFSSCGCILLMCIGFRAGIGVGGIRVWGCIPRCLGGW